jgi:hypothetical protein
LDGISVENRGMRKIFPEIAIKNFKCNIRRLAEGVRLSSVQRSEMNIDRYIATEQNEPVFIKFSWICNISVYGA